MYRISGVCIYRISGICFLFIGRGENGLHGRWAVEIAFLLAAKLRTSCAMLPGPWRDKLAPDRVFLLLERFGWHAVRSVTRVEQSGGFPV